MISTTTPAQGTLTSYTYHEQGRLSSVNGVQYYSYDDNGNVTVTGPDTAQNSYAYVVDETGRVIYSQISSSSGLITTHYYLE